MKMLVSKYLLGMPAHASLFSQETVWSAQARGSALTTFRVAFEAQIVGWDWKEDRLAACPGRTCNRFCVWTQHWHLALLDGVSHRSWLPGYRARTRTRPPLLGTLSRRAQVGWLDQLATKLLCALPG